MSMEEQVSRTHARDVLIHKLLGEGSLAVESASTIHCLRRHGVQVARQFLDRGGYLRMSAPAGGWPGGPTSFLVHRVIAIHAYGLPGSPGLLVNHKNGIKTDNHPDNLEWVTSRQNHRHALATGLIDKRATPFWKSGAEHPMALLTADDVHEILRRFEVGETHAGLAAAFDVSVGAIDNIVRGVSWQAQVPRPRKPRGDARINHQRRGADHHMTTLTDERVRELHRRAQAGGHGLRAALAREFNIGWTTVDYILRGKTWAHIHKEFHP